MPAGWIRAWKEPPKGTDSMERVLSTHVFTNQRLTIALLDKVQRAGIPAVEIFCARQHLDYHDTAQISELGYWFRDSELKVSGMHGPIYNDDVWGRSGPHAVITITELVKGRRVEMVDEIKRALEVAETVPFRYLVQHIGVGEEEYDERKIDAAFSALEELSIFARQRGVDLLLENIPNAYSSAERLNQFLAITHLNLNFVYDVGHANLLGKVESEFSAMKERIRSTHIHDNDGVTDGHLFPLVAEGGTIEWAKAMPMLASRPDQYPLVLELRETAGLGNPIDMAVESFRRLESLIDER